ncbi:MAG: hypothetical protein AAF674_06765 [Pseudomonadota bacterium]
MTHSHVSVAGHMQLAILGPDGEILEAYENHNSVVPHGRALLLSALQGQTTTQRFEPFLGGGDFKAESEAGLEQRDVVRLENIEPLQARQSGNRLILGYRGISTAEAKVVGGGLAAFYKRKGSGRTLNGIYNFAKTRSTVEVRKEMPLMLSFTLTVG